MEALAGILSMVGALAGLVGGVMILVAAFKKSVGWGIASLLIPFAALVFVFMNWAAAKRGFLISLGGAAVSVIGVIVAATLS